YVADRVDATSTVWLGLTTSCAQCHDHKYDPISQREYYEFAAFFNSVRERGLDGQSGNANPFINAPLPDQEERLAELRAAIAETESAMMCDVPEVDSAQSEWEAAWRQRAAERWTVLRPARTRSQHGAE